MLDHAHVDWIEVGVVGTEKIAGGPSLLESSGIPRKTGVPVKGDSLRQGLKNLSRAFR